MPVTMETVENGFVVYYVLTDPWTMDEFIVLFERELEHRRSVSHKVHAVVDCTRTNTVAPGFFQFHKLQPLIRHQPRGSLTLVGFSDLQRAVVNAVLRLARFHNVSSFDTLEEGWAHVRQIIAADQQAIDEAQKDSTPGPATAGQP